MLLISLRVVKRVIGCFLFIFKRVKLIQHNHDKMTHTFVKKKRKTSNKILKYLFKIIIKIQSPIKIIQLNIQLHGTI